MTTEELLETIPLDVPYRAMTEKDGVYTLITTQPYFIDGNGKATAVAIAEIQHYVLILKLSDLGTPVEHVKEVSGIFPREDQRWACAYTISSWTLEPDC